MSFGIFESAISSEAEVGIQRQAALADLHAAVYDVRERLGPSLFQSASIEEFRDRVAMMKHDQSVYKIIAAHLTPVTGVVRRIVGRNSILENEFKSLLRRADFDGTVDTKSTYKPSDSELKPEGDFKGYLDDMDQCGDKVDRNFTEAGPTQEHTKDPAQTLFANYRRWCAANKLSAVRLSSLDAYAVNLPDQYYMVLASMIQACDGMTEHMPKTPKGQGKDKLKDVTAGAHDLSEEPTRAVPALDYPDGYVPGDRFFPPTMHKVPGYPDEHGKHERGIAPGITPPDDTPPEGRMQYIREHGGYPEDIQNERGHSITNPETGDVLHYNNPHTKALQHRLRGGEPIEGIEASLRQSWDHNHKPKIPSTKLKKNDKVAAYLRWCDKVGANALEARSIAFYARGNPRLAYHLGQQALSAMRRTAAPDHLQKAQQALTDLLTQKAEEFQQTIQPLQQALVTVQKANQLQQATSPLGVMPTPGSLDVMPGGLGGPGPGGSQDTAQQIGMPNPGEPDASGLVDMLAQGGGAAGGAPGGAPPPDGGQGAPPPAAGGAPPPQQQQTTARRRGGQGKGKAATRPRQAASVFDLWNHYQQNAPTLRGDDSDYDAFANQYGVGGQALQKLKKQHFQHRPENAAGPGVPKIPTMASRREACWPGCHNNAEHVRKYHKKKVEGRRKQAWSGWGPAQFPKTREVTGWTWNNHLNGYTANRNERFACECGDSFPTPTGFRTCGGCGRQWNSYVIGTGGSSREAAAEKYLVREIPLRPDVIVASRRSAGWEMALPKIRQPIKGVRLVDPRTGAIHNLVDIGECEGGEDPGHPTMKSQPSDWAHRGQDGNKGQFRSRELPV